MEKARWAADNDSTETGDRSALPRTSQRAASREATRKKILATARALFLSSGMDTVSMEDVAQKAELARATIYLHFPGKPALLEALLREDWDGQTRLFERLDASAARDPAVLAGWLRRVVEGMRSARSSFALYRAVFGQSEAITALHHAHRQRLATILRKQLAGVDDGSVTPAPLAVTSLMLVAEIEHLASAAVLHWRDEEVDVAIAITAGRLADLANGKTR